MCCQQTALALLQNNTSQRQDNMLGTGCSCADRTSVDMNGAPHIPTHSLCCLHLLIPCHRRCLSSSFYPNICQTGPHATDDCVAPR